MQMPGPGEFRFVQIPAGRVAKPRGGCSRLELIDALALSLVPTCPKNCKKRNF